MVDSRMYPEIHPEIMQELARPFPSKYIKDDGRGNAYVPHHVVLQRLIHIFGVPPKLEVLREIYDETVVVDESGVVSNVGPGKLTGVILRMTVPGLDPVEEAGESDNPQSKTNGARTKDAISDAFKRCAMRLGCGLHLWSGDDYFLYDKLAGKEQPAYNQLDRELGRDVVEPVPQTERKNPELKAQQIRLKNLVAFIAKNKPSHAVQLPQDWESTWGIQEVKEQIAGLEAVKEMA